MQIDTLLHDARHVRRNTAHLGWSIKDAVNIAADGLRAYADERRWESEARCDRDREISQMAAN